MKSVFRLFYFIVTAQCLASFSFSPIVKDFEPSGRRSIQTFRITNENEDPIAVQISMLTRDMSFSGEEINGDASELFTVYPHQLILQPNDSQSIRVQWKGGETITNEQSYRIVAEQLPINFSSESSNEGQLKIVYRYVGSVYIVPQSPFSKLEIDYVSVQEDSLTIRIRNEGNSHTILEDPILTLSDGVNTISRDYKDLQNISGENILSDSIRDFSIEKPSQLIGEKISGEISYKETR